MFLNFKILVLKPVAKSQLLSAAYMPVSGAGEMKCSSGGK